MAEEIKVVEVDEALLRRVARIVGPSSAAAAALAELERRRARGERPKCYRQGTTFFVGPAIEIGTTSEMEIRE